MTDTISYGNEGQSGRTVVRNQLIGGLEAMNVWIWDTGPEKPRAPERPKVPKGQVGDPEYDLQMLEFKESLESYEAALKRYGEAKKEYADWHDRVKGPIEIVQKSCDAFMSGVSIDQQSTTLANDQRAVRDGRQAKPRYYVSTRTRGWEGRFKDSKEFEPSGLPKGMRAGEGHAYNMRRLAAEEADLAAAMKSDPVFGDQQGRLQ